ncbi:MAG: putative zinc-binding protein [Melioribacteraceae bacterium]|nr:putative zinc-binding protein [Melioribacteraceae bacterium]MCF8354133.1 putative zinc-binding protein [Melioribacteraceae bacterium]MCF8393360.1 putative zinc-binding protein [Melioribacteraceae bacterium]MCF8418925.1 putative zinc-binding protein [Melioribacteraceae bacterium]
MLGSSNVAQIANEIAAKINEEEVAEMSCIAGVGGKVKPLVKTALSGRPIIVIDDCPLKCAKACLNNIGVEPDKHITLTDYNLKKQLNTKINLEDEYEVYEKMVEEIHNLYNELETV